MVCQVEGQVEKILEWYFDGNLVRKDIFGIDLFEVGLSDKVKDYFAKLSSKAGAVREVLQSIK